MTTVPPRPPIPEGRGKRVNTRTYSWWAWTRAYTVSIATWPLWALLWLFAKLVPTLPKGVTAFLLRRHIAYTANHPMDFRIPPSTATPTYMERWWRIPRNAFTNIYYHIVRRSDDDRAHHCHPWRNFSIVLDGGYYEHITLPGGVITRKWYGPGAVRCRMSGKIAHRLELEAYTPERDGVAFQELPARTIFITGPVMRRWGFHDGLRGWIDAYDWDRHCEDYGLAGMKMNGGSDGAISERNHHHA